MLARGAFASVLWFVRVLRAGLREPALAAAAKSAAGEPRLARLERGIGARGNAQRAAERRAEHAAAERRTIVGIRPRAVR